MKEKEIQEELTYTLKLKNENQENLETINQTKEQLNSIFYENKQLLSKFKETWQEGEMAAFLNDYQDEIFEVERNANDALEEDETELISQKKKLENKEMDLCLARKQILER